MCPISTNAARPPFTSAENSNLESKSHGRSARDEAAGEIGGDKVQCPTYGSLTPDYAGLHGADDNAPYSETSRDSGAQP